VPTTNVVKAFNPKELEARHPRVLRRVDKEQVVGIPQLPVGSGQATCASTTNKRQVYRNGRSAFRPHRAWQFSLTWSCSSAARASRFSRGADPQRGLGLYPGRRHVDTRCGGVHIFQAALQLETIPQPELILTAAGTVYSVPSASWNPVVSEGA